VAANQLQLTPAQVAYSPAEQWRQIIRQSLADTRCATPAFLAADMDYVHQTATVQIAIQEQVRTQTGAQWWDIQPITNVPVVLPRGGGWGLTLPLKKGDEGLLVFCDTCFDNWWVGGATGPKADNVQNATGSQRQLELRRHHVHDCGFIPGMVSQPNKLTNYSGTSAQLRSDDGLTVIDLSAGSVKVTGTLGGVAQALVNDTFYQWYVTHIQPFLVSLGYSGPSIPTGSETTILKGQ